MSLALARLNVAVLAPGTRRSLAALAASNRSLLTIASSINKAIFERLASAKALLRRSFSAKIVELLIFVCLNYSIIELSIIRVSTSLRGTFRHDAARKQLTLSHHHHWH